MTVVVPTLACLPRYFLGHPLYARFLGGRVFGLRAEVRSPAHVFEDRVDDVPTRGAVLFGHPYARSIRGRETSLEVPLAEAPELAPERPV